MKKSICLVILLLSALGHSQNGINYKALIKDDLGNVIADNTIQIKFKILESDVQVNVYEETHSPTTDDNGIIIVNIGEGTIISGNFEDINWENDNHFLNVKIDSGSGFVSLGTIQFSAVPYAFHAKKAANVKGLEPLDEGNGVGYRLVGRNQNNYGDIGKNAIDFSLVNGPSLGSGATGNYAFSLGNNGTASGNHALIFGTQNYATNDYALALGNNNIVSGLNSTAIGGINQVSGDYAFVAGLQNEAIENFTVAIGNGTTASGEYALALGQSSIASGLNSTAMGFTTEASGNSSTALGRLTIASGIQSTAIGYQTEASNFSATAMGTGTTASGSASTAMGGFTTASGIQSTATGRSTSASGNYSTAIGYYTSAAALNSTALGRYNVGGGSATSWSGLDPLFEVGNGTGDLSRNNALTIRKNGQHIISSSSSGLTINAENNGIFINNPGGDGIIITNPDDDGITINNSGDNGIIIEQPVNNGIVINAAENVGAVIEGANAGLRVSSTNVDNPDIIIGDPNGPSYDSGVIESIAGSDLTLRSRNDIIVDIGTGFNPWETASFHVKHNGTDVLSADEVGNLEISGRLSLGTEGFDNIGNDRMQVSADFVPNIDGSKRLGNSERRWRYLWVESGTINTSDRRSKTNITNLNYGLTEVLKMQPVSFNWKNKNNPDTKLGLIAQDLLNLVPEVVMTHEWEKDEVSGALTKRELDRLGVYYTDLVPVLINAIKEQQNLIDDLKTTINKQKSTLKNRDATSAKQAEILETLLSRVDALEYSVNQ